MKIIYTILFFLDTALLVWLAWVFLQQWDEQAGISILMALAAAILLCIGLMVFLFNRYIRS
jgi:hypothetical protein